MGFSKMIELLQRKNKGTIILCNAGNFYIARGKDAILFNKIAGLKLNCLETEICKVGFPIVSLEKYTDILEQNKYSYIVYYYDRSKEELEIIKQYKGKKQNEIEENRLNCYICKNTTNYYAKNDKYIEAVAKLYEKEFKQESGNKKWKQKKKKRINCN